MKDKLRELAERWRRRASLSHGKGVLAFANNKCATELLAILDAEGDGGMSLFTGTIGGVHVGLHGTKESVEALDAFLATHPHSPDAADSGRMGEAAKLAGILNGLHEGGYNIETLYTDDQADGDCFVARAADLLREFAALAAQGQGEAQHPDDAAVDAFAAAMKAKLAEARAKGRGGWQDKDDCTQHRLSNMLRDHVEKGDPSDVANFCMFLQQRGEAILPRSLSMMELAADPSLRIAPAPPASPAGVPDAKAMAYRFMGWRLPDDFRPDCGISFDPESLKSWPGMWPTGTNLFHVGQAEQMFRYVLAAAPSAPEGGEVGL